jgi:hypothetical protein
MFYCLSMFYGKIYYVDYIRWSIVANKKNGLRPTEYRQHRTNSVATTDLIGVRPDNLET